MACSCVRLYDSKLAWQARDGMNTTIALGEADTRNIKVNRDLCRSQDDCFLVVDAGIVVDLNDAASANPNLKGDAVPIFTLIGKISIEMR